jgi:cytochrome c-type biogenesis protein CcsB
VNDYLSESNLQRIRSLVRESPDVRNAVGDLDRCVVALADVEADLAIVPRSEGDWLTPLEFRSAGSSTDSLQAVIARAYRTTLDAFAQRDAETFADAAQRLVAANREAARAAGVSDFRIRVDLLHARLKPFRISAALYLVSAIFYLGSISLAKPRLATSAVILLALGLASHILGLTFLGILAGRAPMSNMYESLVFAVAGMTALAVVLDRIYRNALIGFAGALLGFIFMVIAIKMPSEMNPLRPALQSSWLTYHVTTIMLSYSAFALSFFISSAYLLKQSLGGDESGYGWVRRLPALEGLDFYNYRIIAVGFPLLTVGIFTGAVWAATAWGRPWAFDPKETWSAITWLIYGIFLHARLMGGWKGRRSAVLSLVGFAAVIFTYLGVNYLLPGLHSYV